MFFAKRRWRGACWFLLGAALLFTGFARPPTVTLTWQTVSESDSAGFNVYRVDSAYGERVRVNSSLIPSRGNTSSGARYRLRDTEAQRGQTYAYLLEEVGLNGRSTPHPAFQQTHRVRWLPTETWVGLVVLGSGLIHFGRFGKSPAEAGGKNAVSAKIEHR